MNLNNENYTEKSWRILTEKLEMAKAVLIKENASEEEITKAYSELFRAFSELKLKPSKERLESLNIKVKIDLIVKLKDIDNLIQKLELLKLMVNYD